MPERNRRLDPPLVIPKLRLVRASDTTHILRARAQAEAILALIAAQGGGRS